MDERHMTPAEHEALAENLRAVITDDAGRQLRVRSFGATIFDEHGLRFVAPDGEEFWCACGEEIGDDPACPMHTRNR